MPYDGSELLGVAARAAVPAGLGEGRASARQGEPQRVGDPARRGLVVGQQPGQDREAGGVGGGPVLRAQPVGAEVPAGGGRGTPGDDLAVAAVDPLGLVELDQLARALVDGDHVPVALAGVDGAGAPALDARAGRDRHGAAVALVAVVLALDAELERERRLVGGRHVDGDAVVLLADAEVEVDVVPGCLARHDRLGVLVDRPLVDAGVPPVVCREHLAAADGVDAASLLAGSRARRSSRPADLGALGDER